MNPLSATIPFPADDSLLAARKIQLAAPIDDESAKIVITKLLFLQMLNSNAPITLYINCPGGSVTASLAILDTIIGLRPPVHTFATNHCQGTALLILAAGTTGERFVYKDTVLSVEPTTPAPSVPHEKAEFYLTKLNNRLAAILSQHSKLTTQEALEALNHGRHFSTQEAVTLGIVDALAEPDK